MRIAIGGISHETSTFAPTPTTFRDFETETHPPRAASFRTTHPSIGGPITDDPNPGRPLPPRPIPHSIRRDCGQCHTDYLSARPSPTIRSCR